ncbi:Variant-specific surface protein [Giardia duodenalis assemblage B]|uniref:Variant-specific surface protein n=1 Tax=Giardia duodenalis assemblage B TaxID=1394984 RepID=A0A132NLX6_GIAIN|nr:Variant-specific surface protein [Giardia intestinalis assemblage B]
MAETPSVTCSVCTQNKKPNKAGTKCFKCQLADCSHCNADGVCEECDGGKIVKTDKDKTTTCVTEAQCTKAEGFFVKGSNTKTCEACGDNNCITCTEAGNSKCSKCKAINTAGAKLYLKTVSSSPTGTCVEASQCGPTAFPKDDAENGNKCILCGDTTNGVTNCAECTTPAQGKTKPACTKCSTKYLKTAADGTTTCETECGDATNGVPNCAKCTAPSSTGQKPACSECGSGYTLDSQANTCASSSANRSALSTGAIAEISVAAVVVVGGLVGFLCWWFLCRGKA